MKERAAANPPIRFRDVTVTYDEGDGPPPAQITLLEDQSRSILSRNDSPDLDFRWSANPYRGCLHACSYCLDGDTSILMADGRTRALRDLKPGDEIYGTRLASGVRRCVRTRVLDHWRTHKPAFRITLADGTELVASGDHRFLTSRGWTFVRPAEAPMQRPSLTTNDSLVGPGRLAMPRAGSTKIPTHELGLQRARARYRALRASERREQGAFVDQALGAGAAVSFAVVGERAPRRLDLPPLRGLFLADRPARPLERAPVEHRADLQIVSIEPVGERELFDISTGTGDFIANGVVSHNCYARPSHEYLDLGGGTDFDTKITFKPRAAELLREAFDKPSWKGELIMFSGVTDCYQAIEAELKLTQQMLQVCLEYRNPVAIISKSALVERDVELIAELAREAGAHLSVSLAWLDPELARTIEPWAASPARRLRVIETFAKAGVPVGVMCAPVIPGLNDDQLARVLEAARDAGATSAGWALLRLPGVVKQVFEERLRVSLPLAADKVLHRVRETRGGEKLYDSRFHVRGRGEGVYAQTIAAVFDTACKRLGLDARDDERDFVSRFRRPPKGGQLSLF